MTDRFHTKRVAVGKAFIGGGSPITIQSMLSKRAEDTEGNIEQAKALKEAGCDIIRVAIPDMKAVKLIDAIKSNVDVPLVADIHFDYHLALESAAAGVDKIRINPGNISSDEHVKQVADTCRLKGIPIRIGVNSGSLEKHILERYGAPTAEALCESALYHTSLLTRYDFEDIVLSMKSSNVKTMVTAYRLAAERCSFPLHLGVTEAGTERMGIIKSAEGLAPLLLDDIGDTIRVSLTDDPVKEVSAARDILKGLQLYGGVNIISCPTCGRTSIDLIRLAKEAEAALAGVNKDITVAIMGCAVNGPGEAREADIGIAGGNGEAMLFKKGQIIRKIPEAEIIPVLLAEIKAM
ncbi:flavodoxin-dependent (E)-4-hydroxy-3-methylbut-2-enyl-diphosphate synthase [Acetanaerobacterium elongatum]|uniref:4-hydroxy-3-methylbut-2-en-1-yl diphosphate synthase (flavodoxin) n=1 Tax=Acetanaerobacterium elongatum TaxID=258515 RepID=A0A1H0BGE6_9FIRM|nr:flavodoxin-dependent (E)-4-hydroxy-3-methylbut-2-enyl-diphosphate synthase [Acetanaerobacterium elongatum]SDN44717.1 4-hydroxy-3-methylbut-2-en-1-yl diphosphate synthase [Acetanaerobacterium elongatum]